ncbi:MAG: hypothetical protein L6244_04355, partial [Candidatus Methanoperedenaceae archaeon]|nr:hypothetical protein [Candidatus Methanoperedenaceae archaeon]
EETMWVRVSAAQKRFAKNEWGRGWMSEQIRNLINGAIAQSGTEKEKILKQLQVNKLEGNSLQQRLKDIEEAEAKKEKDEKERSAKCEEIINMLVNASRRHSKTSHLLWKTASDKSGISILELRKIVIDRLREGEINEN